MRKKIVGILFTLVLMGELGLVVVAPAGVSAATNTQEFTTSGTFVVPTRVTKITVVTWGGGGAGGGCISSSSSRGGAGGGGGAYAGSTLTVTPGQTVYVVVGVGGIGVSGNNGNPGTPSFVGPDVNPDNALVRAAGGSGGTGNTAGGSPAGGVGGTVANSIGDTRIAGANGGNGATGGGISSGAGGDGANGGGSGGAGISSGTSDGNPGNIYGGGGGGARTGYYAGDRAGGAGAAGKVVITWVTYDLTISSTVGGSVTEPGEGTFTCGEEFVIDLVATPAAGYRFDRWTGDVGTIADIYDATTTITINGDYSIAANFVKVYDLSINSTEGGSVTDPGEGVFTYDEGTVVDLVAEAEEGYRFDEWTGNVSTIADVYAAATNITMNGDYSITSNFVAVYDFTMAADPQEGGTATDLTNGSPYTEGTKVNIKVEANEGYEFVNWTAPAGVFGNTTAVETIFTMPAQNVTVTANFEAVPLPVYPTVTTQAATDVSTGSATLNMNYTVGDFSPVEVRFAYKKSADSAWFYTAWVSKTTDGTHAESLTELNSNTEYEFTAQLKYNDTMEGTTLQFSTDKSSTPPPSGGCFIATAAYGTPMAEEIQILREFRDEYLLTNPVGKGLVNFYYQVSPPIAEFITEHPSLKPIVRAGLLPAVAMSTLAVNATMPDKAVMVSLLVLVLVVALATWVTRRRGRDLQYT